MNKRNVLTLFVIDENGKISSPHVFSRVPNKKLQKEALRVVKLLPHMTPGIRKGKSIGVKYSVSIYYLDGELIIKSKSGPY